VPERSGRRRLQSDVTAIPTHRRGEYPLLHGWIAASVHADASWTPLYVRSTESLPPEEHVAYGPGLSVGYAFVAASGLTAMLGAGVTYDRDRCPRQFGGKEWSRWSRSGSGGPSTVVSGHDARPNKRVKLAARSS
jgi:hypothetical protein